MKNFNIKDTKHFSYETQFHQTCIFTVKFPFITFHHPRTYRIIFAPFLYKFNLMIIITFLKRWIYHSKKMQKMNKKKMLQFRLVKNNLPFVFILCFATRFFCLATWSGLKKTFSISLIHSIRLWWKKKHKISFRVRFVKSQTPRKIHDG